MSLSVTLSPAPGFCIKSTTLQPAVCTPASSASTSSLEPKPTPIPVPAGYKIFVNIAWDSNVPPPPEGSEDAIQRAISGEDFDQNNPDRWFVPVIVSQPRQEFDKAKKPCLVFDCVFNSTLKSRTLRDPEFKIFLIELALQRIEAQAQLVLSRQIGTPNIASKGKLLPRTVSIPAFLAQAQTRDGSIETPKAGSIASLPEQSIKKPLIEEISSVEASSSTNNAAASNSSQKPKGILKNSNASTPTSAALRGTPVLPGSKLTWSWSKDDSNRLQIYISVPHLEKPLISQSTLDLEPRRLILSVPSHPTLDLNLSLSDAELVARSDGGSSVATDLSSSGSTGKHTTSTDSGSKDGVTSLLSLKRQRPFDVEAATAEWIIAENKLVVSV